MAILIPRQLTHEQYIKLFSNPVSGIACEVDFYNRVKMCTQNIRYSKSMLLNALYFWARQIKEFYRRLKRAEFNPTFKIKFQGEDDILDKIMLVHNFPDSFLFSHRHINSKWGTKDSKGMTNQHQLLSKKYPKLFKSAHFTGYTDYKKELCCYIKTTFNLEFTVFPNEHPYIIRQKISKVGMTEKGNVYIIHNNGAQTKK